VVYHLGQTGHDGRIKPVTLFMTL